MQHISVPIDRLCGNHPRWFVSAACHKATDEDGDEFEGNIVGREGGTLCEEIGEGKVRVKRHCLSLESDTHLEDGRNLLQSTRQVILADIIEICGNWRGFGGFPSLFMRTTVSDQLECQPRPVASRAGKSR